MRLALIRHGQAQPAAASDELRALTDFGRQQAAKRAQALAQLPWTNPRLLASPYLRAQQSAAPLSQLCSLPIESCALLKPEADPLACVEFLSGFNQDLILYTHLPLVGRLAALLIDNQRRDQYFDPAECWLLEGEYLGSGCMSLLARYY